MRIHFKSVIVPARMKTALESLFLILPLCISGNAFGADNDSAHLQARKKTELYYQDAQICRSRSKTNPLPEGADPAITIDPTNYLACINQMGYHQDLKTDPFLVAIYRCQNQKTKSVSANGEVQFRAPSQAQVRACLSARGFPSAGTPPNPNAPVTAQKEPASTHSATPKIVPTPPVSSTNGPAQRLSPDEGQIETVIIPPRN